MNSLPGQGFRTYTKTTKNLTLVSWKDTLLDQPWKTAILKNDAHIATIKSKTKKEGIELALHFHS